MKTTEIQNPTVVTLFAHLGKEIVIPGNVLSTDTKMVQVHILPRCNYEMESRAWRDRFIAQTDLDLIFKGAPKRAFLWRAIRRFFTASASDAEKG